MLKKLIGIAPNIESDGSCSPSKFALKLATVKTSDYKEENYVKYYGTRSKILVIFTEQKNMQMRNGKYFSTGNHPIEALLPMLHFQNAGFDFEIATLNGKPVVFEMWAYPNRDKNVDRIYKSLLTKFNSPMSLDEFKNKSFDHSDNYAAIFIPGGHGAMLGIPEDKNVGDVLHWAHKNNLYTISICHGPGALLSTMLNNESFLYKGYKMCVFPDSVDEKTPLVGYLPGKMPWKLCQRLVKQGAHIVNSKADKTVCVDRKLITGASPKASNDLGKIASWTLLQNLNDGLN
tara:strand:- start:160 stop:1026 length:867 start_codon:yes stop_codon:yes gene_type:complete